MPQTPIESIHGLYVAGVAPHSMLLLPVSSLLHFCSSSATMQCGAKTQALIYIRQSHAHPPR